MADVRTASSEELAKMDFVRNLVLELFHRKQVDLDDAMSILLNIIVVSNLDVAGIRIPSEHAAKQIILELARMVEAIPKRYQELIERN